MLASSSLAGNVWDGGGGDGKWSTPANWNGDTLPIATTLLQFGGTSQLASQNDYFAAASSVSGLQFNSGAGPFVLTGNGLKLGGGVINNSTSLQTINVDVDLNSSTRVINAASGPISISGLLSGGGFNKTGSDTLNLNLASPTGAGIRVSAGTLNIVGNLNPSPSSPYSTLTVDAGATLSGTGAISRPVTVNGTVDPGVDGVGTLTISQTAAINGSLKTTFSATSCNKLQVNGNLVFGAANTPSFVGTMTPGVYYILAEYTGTLTGYLNLPLSFFLEYRGGPNRNQIVLFQPTNGYTLWAYSYGLTYSNNGPKQDPDNDGVANLLEFAMGTDPGNATSHMLPTLSLDGDHYSFLIPRDGNSNGASLSAQWSTDLSQWTNITLAYPLTGPVTSEIIGGKSFFRVTIPRSNAVNGTIFARLSVTLPP